jgi:hypothetical protein
VTFDNLAACQPEAIPTSGLQLLPDDGQPYGVEIHMSDDIFLKQMVVAHAGTYIPQHSHTYEHTTMVATGSIRVWEDGKLSGDFTAPTGLMIKAGVKHTFLTLEPHTVLYCIHNMHNSRLVSLLEEHQLQLAA